MAQPSPSPSQLPAQLSRLRLCRPRRPPAARHRPPVIVGRWDDVEKFAGIEAKFISKRHGCRFEMVFHTTQSWEVSVLVHPPSTSSSCCGALRETARATSRHGSLSSGRWAKRLARQRVQSSNS